MEEITAKLPDDPTPDKITAQLDGVARKNGFASYDEYTNVVGNISIVLAGFISIVLAGFAASFIYLSAEQIPNQRERHAACI